MNKQTEHELQADIVQALVLAGFIVRETTAYRQKGPSGVDKGIPDLLVAHTLLPGIYFGMEVKRLGKIRYSSTEQKSAHEAQEFTIVQTVVEAAEWALAMLKDCSKLSNSLQRDAAFAIAINRATSVANQLVGRTL